MKKSALIFSLALNTLLIISAVAFCYKYWDHLYEKFGFTKKTEIVMLGDSLTLGGEWAYLLDRRDVINSGVSGFTTSHLVMILDGKVLKYNPRICFIEGGVNDILVGVPKSRTIRNMSSLIDTLNKHKITPVLQSIVMTTDPSKNIKIDSLNTLYRALAVCKKIDFMDLNAGFSKHGLMINELTVDGIHLKKQAYPIWAIQIKPVLESHKL
jgi:lysophospholipase L1-like esterase